jgi:hypothetical protein
MHKGNPRPPPTSCPDTFRRQDHPLTNFSEEYLHFMQYHMAERQNKHVEGGGRGNRNSIMAGGPSPRSGSKGKGKKISKEELRKKRQNAKRRRSVLLPTLLGMDDSQKITVGKGMDSCTPIREDQYGKFEGGGVGDGGGGDKLLLCPRLSLPACTSITLSPLRYPNISARRSRVQPISPRAEPQIVIGAIRAIRAISKPRR